LFPPERRHRRLGRERSHLLLEHGRRLHLVRGAGNARAGAVGSGRDGERRAEGGGEKMVCTESCRVRESFAFARRSGRVAVAGRGRRRAAETWPWYRRDSRRRGGRSAPARRWQRRLTDPKLASLARIASSAETGSNAERGVSRARERRRGTRTEPRARAGASARGTRTPASRPMSGVSPPR
jgi:hypothetical protein